MKPDEILRHVSRFGDWTLQRYYPVRVVTTWRKPVLAGSFTLAALLLGGGVAVASWQRKAIRVAEERVSFVNRVSHELRTPLTNLLLNTDLALDSLSSEAGEFVVEVEDNGPGIPIGARKRVFLPFELAGTRVNVGSTGTGLGLAISRELAERMGGSLELVPVAKGAKFRLVVPVGERSAR